ncbi:hypothetical protein C8Q78DRAFT_1060963 [Trametes maxima]|nr:hypothetical protein C8Q78DRAFT_1060963 [Trametes maxima]
MHSIVALLFSFFCSLSLLYFRSPSSSAVVDAAPPSRLICFRRSASSYLSYGIKSTGCQRWLWDTGTCQLPPGFVLH